MEKILEVFGNADIKFKELEEIALLADAVRTNEEEDRFRLKQQLLFDVTQDEVCLCRLEEERQSLEASLENTEKELDTIRESRAAAQLKRREDLKKSENLLALKKRKCEDRDKINEGIAAFLDKYGIKVCVVDEKGWQSIMFSRIHPYEEKSYILHFTKMSVRFDKFEVGRAEPDFKEFNQLAEHTNRTQNILDLIRLARKYWLRDVLMSNG